jgi:serine/threonine protein kinase/tetratricopeptide (TPR) repeat protein
MNERDLFVQALDIQDRSERAGFLDQACRNQPALRAAVEQLLQAHERAGTFLNQSPPVLPVAAEETKDSDTFPGQVIAGKYKLLQQIGEGGMGSVWMADQTEPVKRRVAVKLIGSERGNSKSILSRFEAERQAIALMDHPNIAKLLEAGSTDGERGGCPFFVMELLKGVPLTEFCDEHKLSIPERLKLFMQICGAVQHAHQKGIIHRDLKPTNILVEMHDDKPVPMVIDFGLAKALIGQLLTEHTLFTGLGTVAGTPLYMAPEQAKFNAIDIDTRADIYALGVILYELLTGSTPIERGALKKAALDEVLRLVRESEPPTPSKRLSTTQSKPSIAANRHTEPEKLGRFVKGELDWIVMKALAKERDRRYETANGLARDIERFLNHEPVLAGPPSTRYRLRKFVQRNRVQVVAAAMVVLALLAGLVGTTAGLIRADQQRRLAEANELKATQAAEAEAQQRSKAEQARDRTRQALDAMTSTVTGDSLTTQTEISADQKKFLTEVLKYYQQFAGEKADDKTSRARTAAAAYRVGEIENRLGRKKEAVDPFQMARDGYASLATDFPAEPEYRYELGRSRNALGSTLVALGKRSQAEEEFHNAIAINEKLTADLPAVPKYQRELAVSHSSLGSTLLQLGKRSNAEEEIRKALTIREKLAADFATVPTYRSDLAFSHVNLAHLLGELGKRSAAEEEVHKAIAIDQKLIADFPAVPVYRSDLARSHNRWGFLLRELGKHSQAEAEYRETIAIQQKLVADFPAAPVYRSDLAGSHNSFGDLLDGLGKRSEAEGEYRQALAIFDKLVADFPAVPLYRSDLANNHVRLGNLLKDLGKRSEAEREFRQGISILEQLVTDFPAVPGHRNDLAGNHGNLGGLLGELGKRSKAEEEFRKAVVIQEKLVADFPTVPDHRKNLAASHNNLGLIGKPSQAEAEYRKAIAILEKLSDDYAGVPGYREALAGSQVNLGNLLMLLGKQSEADEENRTALAITEKLAADFPTVPGYQHLLANSQMNRGVLLRHIGKRSEAEAEYRKAMAICEKLAADFPSVPRYRLEVAWNHTALGALMHELGKRSEEVEEIRKALVIQARLAADFPEVPKYRHDLAVSRAGLALAQVSTGHVAEGVAEVADLAKSSNWDPITWYNFACVYAAAAGKSPQKKQEYGDRAMDLLNKAVQAGYRNAAEMKRDTDLASLHDREDFKKLVGKLATGNEAAKKP